MEAYDAYCALCCGTLCFQEDVQIGSSEAKALERRRRRVEHKRVTGEDLDEEYSDDDDEMNSDADPETGNTTRENEEEEEQNDVEEVNDDEGIGITEGDEVEDENEEDGDDDDDNDDDDDEGGDEDDAMSDVDADEESSYDPRLVDFNEQFHDEWPKGNGALYIEKDVSGEKRAQYCPKAIYDGGERAMHLFKDKENEPFSSPKFYIGQNEGLDHPCFPMHNSCYQLAIRRLTSKNSASDLNLDALYHTMGMNSRGFGSCLSVGYGDISGADETWSCHPGEEYTVLDPCYIVGEDGNSSSSLLEGRVLAFIHSSIQNSMTVNNNENRSFREKSTKDPLDKLPEHLIYNIIAYLPTRSFLSLRVASLPVFLSTTRPAFWKHYTQKQMPWFWELENLDDSIQEMGIDWVKFYAWLGRETKPSFGISNPLMAIANRRRIWGVLDRLALQYYSIRDSHPEENFDLEVIKEKGFLSSFVFPFRNVTETDQTMLFYHNLKEINQPPISFLSFSEPDRLVGFGVQVQASGTNGRVWGRDNILDHLSVESVFPVPANHWIAGIILGFSTPTRSEKRQVKDVLSKTLADNVIILVERLGGYSTSDWPGNVKYSMPNDRLYRWVLPQPGNAIVGVRSEVLPKDTEGKFGVNFGILETCSPMTAILSAEENRTPALERELLWTYRALYEFKGNLSFHCTRSSKYQARQLLHRLARASHPDSEYWEDLTPHDSILWIREKVDAEMLTRLSFRIGPHRDGGKTVAAVRSEYMKRFWEPKRFARPLEDHDIDEDEWRKLEDNTDELLHFDINGPEGERIVEVGVDSSTKPRALLIRTNKDRSIQVGDTNTSDWVRHIPCDGEIITGLALAIFDCFEDKAEGTMLHSVIAMTRFKSSF